MTKASIEIALINLRVSLRLSCQCADNSAGLITEAIFTAVSELFLVMIFEFEMVYKPKV